MIVTITTEDQGATRRFTGHVVTRTERTLTMLLTEPYPLAGQSVTIPAKHVIDERVLAR